MRRFCPVCASYTVWTKYTGWQTYCVNDTGVRHKVNTLQGKYGYNVYVMKSTQSGGEYRIKRAVFTDDGIVCDGHYHYHKMFRFTVEAMEAEAAAGIFEASLWRDNFPRRTAELLARMKKEVAVAIGDDLPLPLMEIVVDYIW